MAEETPETPAAAGGPITPAETSNDSGPTHDATRNPDRPPNGVEAAVGGTTGDDPGTVDRASALAALLADAGAPSPATLGLPNGEELDAGGNVQRVVIADRVNVILLNAAGDRVGFVQGKRGDVLNLTEADAVRLEKLKSVAELGQLALPESQRLPSEDVLRAMTAPEVVAHVNAHPEDRERVREVEEARPRPRTTVLAHLDNVEDRDPE
jgi:hypothetical protein